MTKKAIEILKRYTGANPVKSQLKTLTALDLRETAVTEAGPADLQKALPNCQISPKPPTTADGG